MKEVNDSVKWKPGKDHFHQASDFSFIALNLVEKAVLHIFLIIVDYVKNALQNKQKISSNAEHFQGKSWKH